MLQTRLPFFPEEIELINNYIGFQKINGTVYYFNGAMPVFQHPEKDYASFRLFTSQLIVNGNVKQVEIARAFNVSAISVKRWVNNVLGQSFFVVNKTISNGLIQNKGSYKKIWVREIRSQSKSGHQTSIVTTNYTLSIIMIGLYMFARWSQENFFKYMMQEFGIDTLASYFKEKITYTSTLVNPEYRILESTRKKITSSLNRIKAKFATLTLQSESIDGKAMEKYISKKEELKDESRLLLKQIYKTDANLIVDDKN